MPRFAAGRRRTPPPNERRIPMLSRRSPIGARLLRSSMRRWWSPRLPRGAVLISFWFDPAQEGTLRRRVSYERRPGLTHECARVRSARAGALAVRADDALPLHLRAADARAAPLLAVMQTLWHRTGDEKWLRLTRFFGTLFLINFAIGVATGLVMEFQFGMNWSVFSDLRRRRLRLAARDRGPRRLHARGDLHRPVGLRLEPALAEGAPRDHLPRLARHVALGVLHPGRRTPGCSTRSATSSTRRPTAPRPTTSSRSSSRGSCSSPGAHILAGLLTAGFLVLGVACWHLRARQERRPLPQRGEARDRRRSAALGDPAGGRERVRRLRDRRPADEDRRPRRRCGTRSSRRRSRSSRSAASPRATRRPRSTSRSRACSRSSRRTRSRARWWA